MDHQVEKIPVSDAGIQLDLQDVAFGGKVDSSASVADLPADTQESTIDGTVPVPESNCISTAVQVPSDNLVTEGGNHSSGIVKIDDQKSSDTDEPLGKRLCLEQGGQTYILALQDGADGLTRVVVNSAVPHSPMLNGQETDALPSDQDVNQAWFTSREDKTNLHNKGHIWKQGMWCKEEIELLENNICQYCEEHNITDPATIIFEMTKDERKNFYRTVAKGLNRPLFSVYRRVIRMYDNKNHVGKYTSEELDRLKKLRSVYGNDWQAIGAAMGRSASSIKDRCRLMKDNCNQGKWLPAEERRLAEAVYELASALPGEMISSGLSWACVAERVGTRSEKQCRTKWLNYLNWKEAGGTEWTREDDIALICRVYGLNATDENMVDWLELSKDWSSVRSPQWLRGKWWGLKRHVPSSCTMTFQETCHFLYQHYAQKIRLKEEAATSSMPSIDCQNDQLSLQHSQLLSRHKPNILRTSTISLTSSPSGIAVTAGTQGLSTSGTTLNTPSVSPSPIDMSEAVSTSTVASVGMAPMLQALEVLPQGLHLAATPQTFLLAQPSQPPIPLTTSLSPSQIIIHAVTTENLQRNENVTVQMHTTPQIIISTANPAALTSLASSQISSAGASSGIDNSEIASTHTTLIDGEETFDAQAITDTELDGVGAINESQMTDVKEVVSAHLILSDPMLAPSNSPEMIVSDLESEKVHGDDSLDPVTASDG